MVLLQWFNPVRGTSRLNQILVLNKFSLVQIKPFQNMTQGAFGEISVNNAAVYLNGNLMLAIHCVEMRRRMLPREDADHNPQESR